MLCMTRILSVRIPAQMRALHWLRSAAFGQATSNATKLHFTNVGTLIILSYTLCVAHKCLLWNRLCLVFVSY